MISIYIVYIYIQTSHFRVKVPFLFRTTLELVWIGDLRYPTKVSYQEAAGLRNFWTLEHCALGTGALKSGFPQATTAVLENEMITNVRGVLSICRYIYIHTIYMQSFGLQFQTEGKYQTECNSGRKSHRGQVRADLTNSGTNLVNLV